MPRVPNTRHVDGGTFFVTTAVAGRRMLFAGDAASQSVVEELQFYRNRGEIELYGFVVMPDHVHVILKVNPPLTISKWVRRFKTYVSRRMGQGPIWQKGYWSELLPDERFLLQKLRYIHENPVRKGMVVDPPEYLWSSAREYFVKGEFTLIDSYHG